MSFEVEDKDVSIDLSNLIGVNLTFGPLQLTLQNILKRLGALEEDNARKTKEIEGLNEALEKLQSQQAEANTPPEDGMDGAEGCGEKEHDAIWAEIDRLNEMLGELTSQEKRRHTIDELYAARKRRDSHVSRESILHSANTNSNRPISASRHDEERPISSSGARPASASAAANAESRASVSGPGEDADHLHAYEEESPTLLGDKVLSKAHEPLPGFDETVRYTETEAKAADIGARDGDSMQPVGEDDTEDPVVESPFTKKHSATPTPTRYEQRRASRLATRRSTHGGSPSFAASVHDSAPSVSDRLKKDSEDIAYLNRVVAEILGEMKTLHDDVDLLQTYNNAGRATEDGESPMEDAQQRLRELEKRIAQLQEVLNAQQDDNADLRAKLEELRRAVKPATRLTEDDVDATKGLPNLQERVRALEDALAAAQSANERLQDKLQSIVDATGGNGGGETVEGISAAQYALLQAAVKALEKQLEELQRSGVGRGTDKDYDEEIARLQDAVRRLQDETSVLESATDANRREAARLEEAKADKSDVLGTLADLRADMGREAVTKRESVGSGSGAGSETRMNDLQTMLEDALSRIARLDDDKADRTALQRLRDDLAALKRLTELNAQRDAAALAAATSGGSNSASGAPSGVGLNEALLQEIQQQLMAQAESFSKDRDATGDDLDGLRDLIDQLDRRKADAALVANKAERDYVENALERLMREVEQVLNATNAGLIDTLDKSLNILRDMIDGKANKHDIQRLQQQMAAEGAGGSGSGAAADGLTGFKGYRCLGCNRAMDSLRPRNTAAKMSTFLNRTPQNFPHDGVTRAIQAQQQQQPSGLYMSGTANSEPLPPIEEGPR